MFDKTVLPNGLRIVSSSLPHTRSVSINIFIGAGSRYESDDMAGVSHFLEHMLFKGTKRRPTAREISEEIEGIGGVMNAGTDKELTVYWAKVGDQHFAATLDILADSLLNSLLEPTEIEKEREVILEELAMTEDSPADIVNILIDEVVWPPSHSGATRAARPTASRATTRDDVDPLHGPAVCAAEHGRCRGRQRDPRRDRRARDRVAGRLGARAVRYLVPSRDPDDTPRLRVRSKRPSRRTSVWRRPGCRQRTPIATCSTC